MGNVKSAPVFGLIGSTASQNCLAGRVVCLYSVHASYGGGGSRTSYDKLLYFVSGKISKSLHF